MTNIDLSIGNLDAPSSTPADSSNIAIEDLSQTGPNTGSTFRWSILNLLSWIRGKNTPTTTTITSSTNVSVSTLTGSTVLGDATAGSVTATLPSGATMGQSWRTTVRKIDSGSNTVTVACSGSDAIGYTGSTSFVLLAQGDYVTLMWDGTHWQVVETNGPLVRTTVTSFSGTPTSTFQSIASSALSLAPGVYDIKADGTIVGIVSSAGYYAVNMSLSQSASNNPNLTCSVGGYGNTSVVGTFDLSSRVFLNAPSVWYLWYSSSQSGTIGTAYHVKIDARRIG